MSNRIKTPNSQLEETLYSLILSGNIGITVRSMIIHTGILNVKARILDLRHKHGLSIKLEMVKTENKFGRKVKYGKWTLPFDQRIKALEVYKKLQDE